MSYQQNPTSTIQAIHDLCRYTFTPSTVFPPPPPDIHNLTSLLDTLGPADVGLSDGSKEDDGGCDSSSSIVDECAKPINYVDVHAGENFTMCMFCFPASSVIPLHDHPGMTVLSKVLYGTLHVKAYDWVEPGCLRKIEGNDNSSVTVRLAKLAVDTVLMAPCKTSVLYPRSGGNLHIFTAVTPCAVLDIIGFSSSDRRGSYYRDYPCSILPDETVVGKDEEGYAWLAEIDTPAEMHNVASRNYTGPAIQK